MAVETTTDNRAWRQRARRLYDELVRENAMMDEPLRYVRQFMRTGGETGKGVNYAILGLLALLYLWVMALMVRFHAALTVPIEYVQLVAVTLITPISMYAAISGEREKATWEALVLTRLTPAQIIAGKLLWRIALMLAVMAVLFVMLLLGELVGDPWGKQGAIEVLLGQSLILTWGVLMAAFSLWVSAKTRRSITSLGTIIGVAGGVLILLPALFGLFGADGQLIYETPWNGIWRAGPADYMFWAVSSPNPFILLSVIGNTIGSDTVIPAKTMSFLVTMLYIAATVLFLWLTWRNVRRMEEPQRMPAA